MSASIKWRLAEKGWNHVQTMTPSRFVSSLENTWGNLPITLGPDDVPILKAMHIASDIEGYKSLYLAIENRGAIEIKAEY